MSDETAPSYDATDPVAENNAKRDAERIRRADANVIRGILHTKPGRDWFYRQLGKCHIYGSAFTPGQPDVTAFALGEENIGKQWMLAAIDASPDLYMKMLTEQKEEESRLDEVRRSEEKKRQDPDEPGAVETQGLNLPPPVGFPGGPAKPPGPPRKK